MPRIKKINFVRLIGKNVLFSLGLLFCCQSLLAAEIEECSLVENPQERLACFDRQFPRNTSVTPGARVAGENKSLPPKASSVPIVESASVQPKPVQQKVGSSHSTEKAIEDGEGEDDAPIYSNEKKGGGLFDRKKKINFTSGIIAVKREDKRKMLFRLENQQIWIQVSPRELAISKGDIATIKSALAGGYILRTDRGTSTRVRRIQ